MEICNSHFGEFGLYNMIFLIYNLYNGFYIIKKLYYFFFLVSSYLDNRIFSKLTNYTRLILFNNKNLMKTYVVGISDFDTSISIQNII